MSALGRLLSLARARFHEKRSGSFLAQSGSSAGIEKLTLVDGESRLKSGRSSDIFSGSSGRLELAENGWSMCCKQKE